MPRKIVKKILPAYFDLIAQGIKKYEFRLADFDVSEGDTLVLEEWDSEDKATRKPTGRTMEKKVGYTRKFSIDELNQLAEIKEKGFYIIQLED